MNAVLKQLNYSEVCMEDSLEAKEKLASNLMSLSGRAHDRTLIYIVHKTIEKNPNITLAQLEWLLSTEYLLSSDVISRIVASLMSKTLFECVSRWQPPGRSETIHLRIKESVEFNQWMERSVKEHPELLVFNPPIFQPRNKKKNP